MLEETLFNTWASRPLVVVVTNGSQCCLNLKTTYENIPLPGLQAGLLHSDSLEGSPRVVYFKTSYNPNMQIGLIKITEPIT